MTKNTVSSYQYESITSDKTSAFDIQFHTYTCFSTYNRFVKYTKCGPDQT